MASRSRWLVGSSSSSKSERHISARARFSRTRQPPENSRDRAVDFGIVETEAMHELRCAGARRIAADAVHVFMQFGDARAVVRLLPPPARSRSSWRSSASPSSTYSIASLIGGGRLLRDVRDDQPGLDLELARILVQFAEKQREQAGLAAAVGAGDADLLAAIEGEAGVFEQHFDAAAKLQVAQQDHGLRIGEGGRLRRKWGG